DEPAMAPAAGATRDVWLDDDALAGAQAEHVVARLPDDADELVAEHDADPARVAGRPAQDVEVGAADAARLDVDEHVARLAQARPRPLGDRERPLFDQDRSGHP